MKKIATYILNFTGIVPFQSMLPFSTAGFLSFFSNFFFKLPGINQLQIYCLDILFQNELLLETRLLYPVISTNTEEGNKRSDLI